MYDPVKVYKSEKKANWINYQLAQHLLVYCRINGRVVVIKKAKQEGDSVVINGNKNLKLENQTVYSSKRSDPTNPIGTFEDRTLNAAESVDLICRCIW